MIIAILIIVILILFFLIVGLQTLNGRLENLENTLEQLYEESKDPNYHGVGEDGYPYTISKH